MLPSERIFLAVFYLLVIAGMAALLWFALTDGSG